MKRPEYGEKDNTELRLYNMSDKVSTASIKCFKEIKGVDEVNPNEEYIEKVNFNSNAVDLKFGAWEIKTINIKF